MSNLGLTLDGQLPDGSEAPESPQIGRPKALSKTPRSSRMVLAPNESTTAIVLPWPWLPAASSLA